MSSQETGLFLAYYQVGTGEFGAPMLTLRLAINTVHRTVHGIGEIAQEVNPPVEVLTRVDGTYLNILIMGSPSTLVEATGMPPVHFPPDRRRGMGPGPVILPNLFLRMVLQGWESGTAYYRYQTAEGQWVEVNDVPVKRFEIPPDNAS